MAFLKLSCQEGLAEGRDVSHKAEWARVSCQGNRWVSRASLLGQEVEGWTEGTPHADEENSTALSYTHPSDSLLSLLLSPIQTHTHTHMDALLPTYSMYTCACTSLMSSVWDSLSGRDNNLNRICSLKIFALSRSVTLADIHFPSMKRGNSCMCLWWLMSLSQEKLPYVEEIRAAGGGEEWLWYALNMIAIVMQ